MLYRRFYSSTFKTVRPPIFFKHNQINKTKEKEKIFVKTKLVKERPLNDEIQKIEENQLNEDFISSDLLTDCNIKKSKISFNIDNKKKELLYGIHPVLLALKSNRRSFYNAYLKESSLKNNIKLQEINELCKEQLIPTNYINEKRFKHLLGPEKLHQGICMEASNCPITSVVSKASSGIAEILPIHQILNIEEFLQNIRNHGFQIVSSLAHSNEALPLQKFQRAEKMLLIVGNEGRGVSPVVERHSDVAITIPPASNCIEDTHSLNVSVATSVILHFLSRQ
ncbi:rRNA methyltransferase 1, mitochondrial [Armadillidium nasatum]|uniref:rRNA methyltransferase 1, mitochondrial n=1 Tax=Armadillidium nasatum TaxID=96803 RepID=A0A5N5T8R0_9CRUS|nr:rRNA methyltransferase 1, mitochondrial [Armadillidium nasatum]